MMSLVHLTAMSQPIISAPIVQTLECDMKNVVSVVKLKRLLFLQATVLVVRLPFNPPPVTKAVFLSLYVPDVTKPIKFLQQNWDTHSLTVFVNFVKYPIWMSLLPIQKMTCTVCILISVVSFQTMVPVLLTNLVYSSIITRRLPLQRLLFYWFKREVYGEERLFALEQI